MQCRLCGADQGQSIRASTVYGGREDQNFWSCPNCQVVYLEPPPTPEEEERFYREEFEKFMKARAGADRDWSGPQQHARTNQDQVVRRMERLRPWLKPGGAAVELGCSSGFMLDALQEAGQQVVGIEPGGVFSDYLGRRGHEVYSDLRVLRDQQPDRRFDLAVSFFVFEHMRDPRRFVQEQLEVLKPGGVLVAEIPCLNDALTSLYTIEAFEAFYWSAVHHFYHSPGSLAHLMAGLDCEWWTEPDQRYDLSNHLVWMMEGRPGGQGRFADVFSAATVDGYRADLIRSGYYDTIWLYAKLSNIGSGVSL